MAGEADSLRNRGNESFNKSNTHGRPLGLIINDINEALDLYDQSFSVRGASITQKSSAKKNAAKACWKITGTLKREQWPKCHPELFRYYSKALEYFRRALELSKGCREDSWIQGLEDNFDRCFDEVVKTLEDVRYDESIPSLQFCLLTVVSCYIQKGSDAMANKEYQRAIDFFKDCNRPMEELHAQQHSSDHMHEAVVNLHKDLRLKCNTSEAWMLLEIGIKSFEKIIQNDGDLDTNCMYDTMDRFNAAILKSKETNLELEAIANNYLGQVYYKALNHKVRAKEHFNKCLYYVDMLQLDNLSRLDWYQACRKGLDECQEKSTMPGENISSIKAAREKYNDAEYIHFIVSEFPSRTRKVNLPTKDALRTMDKSKLKSFMPKLIFAYHPDKQTGQENDWREVCEEISKGLNGILDTVRKMK